MTPDYIKSIHNITYPFHNKGEVLLLGQCYSENPKYALTARNDLYGININIYDEIDTTFRKSRTKIYVIFMQRIYRH